MPVCLCVQRCDEAEEQPEEHAGPRAQRDGIGEAVEQVREQAAAEAERQRAHGKTHGRAARRPLAGRLQLHRKGSEGEGEDYQS